MAEMLAKIADAADANPMDNPLWNSNRADAIRSFLARHRVDPKQERPPTTSRDGIPGTAVSHILVP
jgi:hypothetical protein